MLNEDKIKRIYCIVDDILKGIGHLEDSRCKLSDSEVITTILVSAMLDKSRFIRRPHGVAELVYSMFCQLGHYLKSITGASEYVIDSFRVAV